MPYTEVQTIEAFGGQYTEIRYEPEYKEVVETDLAYYITAIANPDDDSRYRYLVDLFNPSTKEGQRVDLVIQESGFAPMIAEIRNHFGYGWEVFSWLDCQTPF